MSIKFRRARSGDAEQIKALVLTERLNPTGLVWSNFWVVERAGKIVGAAQVRPHEDGSRELGSLVLAPSERGRALSYGLIAEILAEEPGPIYGITARQFAWYFEPLGFKARSAIGAPGAILRNYVIGQLASGLALLQRRRPRRLVVLERPATTARGNVVTVAARGL